MRVIWKFPLPVEPIYRVAMPAGATLLTVQMQCEQVVVWGMVDSEAPRVEREFYLVGTGHPVLSSKPTYLGTVQPWSWRGLVLHVFDGGEIKGE